MTTQEIIKDAIRKAAAAKAEAARVRKEIILKNLKTRLTP